MTDADTTKAVIAYDPLRPPAKRAGLPCHFTLRAEVVPGESVRLVGTTSGRVHAGFTAALTPSQAAQHLRDDATVDRARSWLLGLGRERRLTFGSLLQAWRDAFVYKQGFAVGDLARVVAGDFLEEHGGDDAWADGGLIRPQAVTEPADLPVDCTFKLGDVALVYIPAGRGGHVLKGVYGVIRKITARTVVVRTAGGSRTVGLFAFADDNRSSEPQSRVPEDRPTDVRRITFPRAETPPAP